MMLSRFNLLLLLSLVQLSTTQILPEESRFQVAYEWTYLNYTWQNSEQYQNALKSKTYIPENNLIGGFKIFEGNVYVTLPKVRSGVPISLGFFPKNSQKTNPIVTPFPNWELNQHSDCHHLQNVLGMEIDSKGIMWILDGVRVIPTLFPCPAKLVLLDLKQGGKLVDSFDFSADLCLKHAGLLNDLVVDENGDFAYITDASGVDPGLIVFSRGAKNAWKLRQPELYPENDCILVDGVGYTNPTEIDGIALGPTDPKTGFRNVYFTPLTGYNLYSISTEVLKNVTLCQKRDWKKQVKFIGRKESQTDGMIVDSKGDLYYGLLMKYGVGKWNVGEPFASAKVVEIDKKLITWPDTFAFDSDGYLHLLASNIHKYFDKTFELKINDESKFRILKKFTGTNSYLYANT